MNSLIVSMEIGMNRVAVVTTLNRRIRLDDSKGAKMILVWPTKDPDENLDYIIDWTSRTANDRITASSFILSSNTGLTMGANSYTNTTATVWLSSGTSGKQAKVTNRVTTFSGRIFEESIYLPIKSR